MKSFQVIHNLIPNAIKFTDTNGKVSIEVTDTNDTVQIKVSDNGIGIPGVPSSASVQEEYTRGTGGIKRGEVNRDGFIHREETGRTDGRKDQFLDGRASGVSLYHGAPKKLSFLMKN